MLLWWKNEAGELCLKSGGNYFERLCKPLSLNILPFISCFPSDIAVKSCLNEWEGKGKPLSGFFTQHHSLTAESVAWLHQVQWTTLSAEGLNPKLHFKHCSPGWKSWRLLRVSLFCQKTVKYVTPLISIQSRFASSHADMSDSAEKKQNHFRVTVHALAIELFPSGKQYKSPI